MDLHEIATIVSAFTITQQHMLLILETLLPDNKRITHILADARHRIRHLTFFRMIHASDLVCQKSMWMDRRCFTILCHILQTRTDLESTERVVEEMVALFLHVLAHDLCKIRNCVPYLLENCLGVLDDTYIKVNMSTADRPRYHTRKDEVATNVLDVCNTKGDFVFILVG
uniref:Retrotransposon protein n=1 Tax=Cucumis melo TaxID=3656 RepID=A0A9I9EDA4_CUCME